MALKVSNLNGDSTFLLTFAPSEAEAANPGGVGCFSILLDPWLSGDSTIFHRKFAVAKHTIPSSIQHLSEIPTPDAVLISQDRSDHCHEATLKQLDPELPHTIIFGHPAAVRKIRSWKYFNPSKLVAFSTYNDRKRETVIRFKIPSGSPELQPGEVTLAFIPTKFDITQLHNGIGITYRPPMRPQSLLMPLISPVSITPPVKQTTAPSSALMPPTPPESPMLSQWSPGLRTPILEAPPPRKGALNKLRSRSHGALQAAASAQNESNKSTSDISIPPLPPLPLSACPSSPNARFPASPALSLMSSTTTTTTSSSSTRKPRTMSVIYAPHGVSYAAIRHYAVTHLIRNSALPLTLLLHAFDRVQNVWYLGGNIIAGLPGGLTIARNLLAQVWIAAHDEDKESSGIAVVQCTIDKYSKDDVRRLLAAPDLPQWKNGRERRGSLEAKPPKSPSRPKSARLTDVRQMGCGETAILTA